MKQSNPAANEMTTLHCIALLFIIYNVQTLDDLAEYPVVAFGGELVTFRLVLDHTELCTATLDLHAGDHGLELFLHLVGMVSLHTDFTSREEPDDAEPGGAQVHSVGLCNAPLRGRLRVLLPEAVHHGRPHLVGVRRRHEVGGAEAVAVPDGRDPKPELVLGDVLGEAGERQHPVAGLAPRLVPRVEAEGLRAVVVGHGDASAGDHRVGVDPGAKVTGTIVHVGRRIERAPAPAVVVVVGEELDIVRAATVGRLGDRVHDVEAVADSEGEGRELGRRQARQGMDARGQDGVANETAARVVHGDHHVVPPIVPLVLEECEVNRTGAVLQVGRAQIYDGTRKATAVSYRRRKSSSSPVAVECVGVPSVDARKKKRDVSMRRRE
jgi:hypothetical protein